MFGVLCGRPRIWFSYTHGAAAAPFDRLRSPPLHPPPAAASDTRDYSAGCPPWSSGAASVWHTILPSNWRRRPVFGRHESDSVKLGEGSWNAAWDARPARWLHHPDSAWLLFGVSGGLPLIDFDPDSKSEVLVAIEDSIIIKYRVREVAADGRCLFRAVAHMACLMKGEAAPDEVRQRELADELRAQVVEELFKRRKEVEGFLGEKLDVYVKEIEQPYVWGGEVELRMCSHILRAPIQVFRKDKGSANLIKGSSYGNEYKKEEVGNFITVLYHGYGHYEALEALTYSS